MSGNTVDAEDELYTKIYSVPPNFLATPRSSGGEPIDPFAPSDGDLQPRMTAQEALEWAGVTFGPGAFAHGNLGFSGIVVRNTQAQHELVEAYLEPICIFRAPQVTVIVEWIELDRSALSDWLFDHPLDADGTPLRRWLQDRVRRGEAVVLDTSLINARSGQRAKTESILDYIHPSELDPPEIPETVGLADESEAPTTASSPAAFEVRHLGRTLEVDAVIGADETTIDLALSPESVELVDSSEWPSENTPAKFRHQMPTFHTSRITHQIVLTDGHYALLGTVTPHEPALEDCDDPIVVVFARADIGRPGTADER